MSENKKEINGKALSVGVVAWFVFCLYTANQFSCLAAHNCGAGDLFLGLIMGVGMLAPAWFVYELCKSIIFKD